MSKIKHNKTGIDKFSLMHVIFGFNLAVYMVIVSQLFINLEIFVSVFLALVIILTWEVIENLVISKTKKGKNWKETAINIEMDILIGTISFFILFVSLYYVNDVSVSIFFWTFISIFTVILYYTIKNKKR
jgi:hypothetical protein